MSRPSAITNVKPIPLTRVNNQSTGVACPRCGTTETQTVNSRPSNGTIRRWRCCRRCAGRFTTIETILDAEGLPIIGDLPKLKKLRAAAAEIQRQIAAMLGEEPT